MDSYDTSFIDDQAVESEGEGDDDDEDGTEDDNQEDEADGEQDPEDDAAQASEDDAEQDAGDVDEAEAHSPEDIIMSDVEAVEATPASLDDSSAPVLSEAEGMISVLYLVSMPSLTAFLRRRRPRTCSNQGCGRRSCSV